MPEPLDFAGLTTRLQGHLERLGCFRSVHLVEPKSPPGKGVSAALWLQDWAPWQRASGANTVSLRLAFTLRLYRPAFAESRDELDRELVGAAGRVARALSDDLLVGDEVMAVDLFGMAGVPMRGQAGYVQMADRSFRIMDTTIPVIIADVWTQGAQ